MGGTQVTASLVLVLRPCLKAGDAGTQDDSRPGTQAGRKRDAGRERGEESVRRGAPVVSPFSRNQEAPKHEDPAPPADGPKSAARAPQAGCTRQPSPVSQSLFRLDRVFQGPSSATPGKATPQKARDFSFTERVHPAIGARP